MRATLNEVATVAPEWLQAMAPAAWYERYGRPVENYRLPKTETARQDLAATIGADGQQLLGAIDAATAQPELALLPMVQVLRQVWAMQYITEWDWPTLVDSLRAWLFTFPSRSFGNAPVRKRWVICIQERSAGAPDYRTLQCS